MVVEERQATESHPSGGIEPLDEEAVQFMADRLKMDGYCVLENAVPLDLIERLRERFDQLLETRIQADGPNRGANRPRPGPPGADHGLPPPDDAGGLDLAPGRALLAPRYAQPG